MQLGMIGLGRMGANIVRRLMRDGHTCVVYDRDDSVVASLAAEGAVPTGSLAELSEKLDPPRAVWVMVPAGITGAVVDNVAATLAPGDIVIDGGNSNYRDDLTRAAELATKGIEYVDCGTSGGVFGLERGYCLMVGASDAAFARIEPILRTLAPGIETAPRTTGRTG
ncbi:MAG TPA: NAD(P)-binding domain-containing protein, partial [Acidimicrobiia bacterium]|nr:NAD(P)-binding domain-containing protein [Acidimicrobiia bacterium]